MVCKDHQLATTAASGASAATFLETTDLAMASASSWYTTDAVGYLFLILDHDESETYFSAFTELASRESWSCLGASASILCCRPLPPALSN